MAPPDPAAAVARRAGRCGSATTSTPCCPEVDVVYLLRMQRERMDEALLPSLREYTACYGLTRRRVGLLDDKAIVMHPGPMNRGVEIAADVADLPRVGGDRPGAQRGGGAHGRAVRPAGLGTRPGPGRRSGRSTMTSIAIRGGEVVDASGARRADVLRRRRPHRRRGRPTGRRRRPTSCSTPAAASCRPAWSTCTRHLRQPGNEEAETVETGARAAALGGFTCVLAMPNTDAGHRLGRRGARGARAGRGARAATSAPSASITVGRGGDAARADGRAGRAGRAVLHRRRQRRAGRPPHASGPRVRAGPGRDPGPALRGRGAGRRRGA